MGLAVLSGAGASRGDEDASKKDAISRHSTRGKTRIKNDRSSDERASDSAPLPGHLRSGTGRLSDPHGVRGDSKIEAAGATSAADERTVDPIIPPREPPADPTQPPPWLNPIPREPPRTPQPGATPDAATAKAESADASVDQAAPSATTVDAGEPSAAAPVKLKLEPAPKPEPIPLASPDDPAIVVDPLDQIRAEIKARLPFFQACAIAARRRAGIDVRRVQATWFINADGTIRELRLDGVPEAQLATCITRVASRAFPVAPGVELTIPTPIVFVR